MNKLTKVVIFLFFILILTTTVRAFYTPTGGTSYTNILIQDEPADPLELGVTADDLFPDTAECPNGVRWTCWSRMNGLTAPLSNGDLQNTNSVVMCANDSLNDIGTNGSQWNEGINVSGIQYDIAGYFQPLNNSLFPSIECDIENELRVVWQDIVYVNSESVWKGMYSETKDTGNTFTYPSLITPATGFLVADDGYDMLNWDLAIHQNVTYFVWQQNNYSMDQNFNYNLDVMIASHWEVWATKVTDGEIAQDGTFTQVATNICNQTDLDYDTWYSICLFPQAIHTSTAGEQMHVVFEFINVTPAEGTIDPIYQQGKDIYYVNTTSLAPLTFHADGYEVANGTYGDVLVDDVTSYWRPRIDNGTDEALHLTYWIYELKNSAPPRDDKNVRYMEINSSFQAGDFSEEYNLTEEIFNFDIDLYSPDISCDNDDGVTISFLHDIIDIDQDYINYTNKSVYDSFADWNEPYDNVSFKNKYNIDFVNEGRTPQTLFLLEENSSSFAWHWYTLELAVTDYNVSGSFWEGVVGGGPGPEPPNVIPTIYLLSPANNTNTTDTTPTFRFYFTDPNNVTCACYLYTNSTLRASGWVANNTNTPFTSSELALGNWTWWVNCSDLIGENKSNVRDLLVWPAPVTPDAPLDISWQMGEMQKIVALLLILTMVLLVSAVMALKGGGGMAQAIFMLMGMGAVFGVVWTVIRLVQLLR